MEEGRADPTGTEVAWRRDSTSRIFMSFPSSFKFTSVQLSSLEFVGLLSSAMVSLEEDSTSRPSFSVEFMFKELPSESMLCMSGVWDLNII